MRVDRHRFDLTYLLSYASIFHLGPWRNSIHLWTQRGSSVNLIQFRDEDISSYRSLRDVTYKLIQIPYPFFLRGSLYALKYLFRLMVKVGLNEISTYGDGVAYLLQSFYFICFAYLKLRHLPTDVYIAGDSPSLVAAYLLAKRNKKRYIFWELELHLEREQTDFGRRLLKRMEKSCSKHVLCGVEFGEKRAELLRKENRIPSSVPIFSIPNSPLGCPRILRNYYFNEKFGIPIDKKIVLFAGSIFADRNEIRFLWDSFEKWDINHVLVIHSRTKSNAATNIVVPQHLMRAGRIFFNDEPLAHEKVDQIYASCDIGLILNRLKGVMNSNLYYSDLSLGKLFHFAHYGIPIISRRLYGYTELIEGTGIGLCFDDPDDIGFLVRQITNEDAQYKENCIIFSNRYAFADYHEEVVHFVEKSVG